MTMKHIFEDLFRACDRKLEDYITSYPKQKQIIDYQLSMALLDIAN